MCQHESPYIYTLSSQESFTLLTNNNLSIKTTLIRLSPAENQEFLVFFLGTHDKDCVMVHPGCYHHPSLSNVQCELIS